MPRESAASGVSKISIPAETAVSLLRVQREMAIAGANTLVLAQRIADRAVELTDADRSVVGFLDSHDLVVVAAGGASGLQVGMRLPAASGFIADCINNRVPTPCNVESLEFTDSVGNTSLTFDGALGVPLMTARDVLGLLIARKKDASAISNTDLYTLEMLAGMLSTCVANARMVQDRETLIENRTRALEEVRLQEQRFRSLIENAADPIVIVDESARTIYASPANKRVTGYSPREVAGGGMGLLHPDDLAPAQATLQDLIKNPGKTVKLNVRSRHKAGHWIDLETTATNLISHKAVGGIVVNIHDVTEEIRARDTEATLAAIVQSTSDAIIVTSPDGKITSWNSGAEKLYGYSADEVVGKEGGFLQPPGQTRDIHSMVREMSDNEGSMRYETVRIKKDGTPVTVSVTASLLRDKQGKVIGAFGISRDITENRHLEEELRQAQKMEAVGRLAGGIAHDFNNILTAISANAELAMEELAANSPLRQDLMEIRRAGKRAASLTGQLLAFSRKQVLKPQIINLNAVVRAVEEMLRRMIGEDIALNTSFADDLAFIRADPTQLEQVMMNLAVNARDAMPKGGVLTLRTSNAHAQLPLGDSPSALLAGDYVLLEIGDTGIGIDPKIKNRIFEPFFTTKEPGKGTGLGLSTVYGIVRQSDGYITMESKPGKGTIFKLYFPTVKEETGEKIRIDSGEHAKLAGGTETILLVEDDEAVRLPLKRALTRLGYTVMEATDGQDALALLEKTGRPVDLLLTDVVMPGMSGRELAAKLRERDPDLRVFFMSGYSEDAVASHGAMAERAIFIAKPFAINVLVRKIRELFDADK
jgi:two-component system cell cycle sensor histidine kinase/response regulator CckA